MGSDIEAGSSLVASSRLVRRAMARKARLILGAVTLVVVGFFLYDRAMGGHRTMWGGFEEEAIPEFIVDAYGDYFYHDYPQRNIPGDDPDLSTLPDPRDVFADIDLQTHLTPPQIRAFPSSRLAEVHSPPAVAAKEKAVYTVEDDAYSQTWQPPADWDAPGVELPSVQWDGFKRGGYESPEEKEVREERREAVRRGFVHAWQAYKDHAWGHDEVKPVSKMAADPFNTWGASIIDTLDTLLLMGLPDEFNLCRAHVNQLNFHWIHGQDWADGYVFDPSSVPAARTTEPLIQTRDKTVTLGVFETGIRYLGGLLGGYDLSGDQLLLDRAVELAGVLGKAFNSSSGLPAGHMNPGTVDGIRLSSISSAEVGSMSLELIRLSQVTRDRQWFDLAQRATEYIAARVAPRSVFPPMLPHTFQPDAALTQSMTGTFAWGGLIDSYYEYLIKVYHLLRGSPASSVYRDLYERSIDASRELLFKRTAVVPGKDLLVIGKWEFRYVPEIEHLTCFAGAMLGLGARLLNRDDDLLDAQDITQTCYWLSAATPTGMQPELAEFYDIGEQAILYENVTLPIATDDNPTGRGTERLHHPHASKLDTTQEEAASRMVRDRSEVWHWSSDGIPVKPEHGGRNDPAPQAYYRRIKGTPAGTKKTLPRALNRPETIESIFYMYRLTGDKKWQDRGWAMFVAWTRTARIPGGGMSSLMDTTRERNNVVFTDNMESFTFAETFKYHLLLQSEPDYLSLDDYVLNTEAHPFSTNPSRNPGASSLWPGPPPSTHPHAVLGVRGQGTDVQKWARHAVLDRTRQRFRPAEDGGVTLLPEGMLPGRKGSSGKGMGGGGGSPNHRPKPPPEFLQGL